MRLIDADLFMDFIKEELKQDRPDFIHIRNIIRILEDLPTAYDVDKVVEQLECEEGTVCGHKLINKNCFGCEGCDDCKMEDAYRYAIEIIKAGGIDES